VSKIDDPFEAEWDAATQPVQSAGTAAAQSALTILGQFSWWLKPVIAAFNLFSAKAKQKRVMEMLTALHGQMVRLGKTYDDLDKRFNMLSSSPEFITAVYAAMEGAANRPDSSKSMLLGTALANSLIVIPNAESFEQYIGADLEAIIRDLAQLNDLDLKVLTILREVFLGVLGMLPNLNDDNYFTEKFDQYRKAISDNNIHPDDFYSQCCRLMGFGLAMQVRHNPSRMTLDAHMFRPTRRGLRLLKLIAEDPTKL
jgi:hypothetical protein